MLSEDQHPGIRRLELDLAGGLEAVHAFHGDVYDRPVWPVLYVSCHGLVAIGTFCELAYEIGKHAAEELVVGNARSLGWDCFALPRRAAGRGQINGGATA